MEYLDFDLALEELAYSPRRYRARVLASPAGEASAEFVLPFSQFESENYILKIGRVRRGARGLNSSEGKAAQDFGSKLYDAIFKDSVRDCLRRSLDIATQQPEQGLRLRLRLTDAPALTDLPWEYLYDTASKRFFAHSVTTPIVRYLDLPEPLQPLAVQPPLNILVMIANPQDGYAPLDVEAEWRRVQEALADLIQRGLVTLTRLENATLTALQHQLRRENYHILHFIGHGTFDQQIQEGAMLLENERGMTWRVNGSYLGALLHDHRSLRLVVLNACEGARTTQSDPLAGIAQTLVQQGIPAVVAMQFEITDQAAITFAHGFYSALADGYPVDGSLAEARRAIFFSGNDVEWGTPVLYLRAQNGNIFDLSKPQPTSPLHPLRDATESVTSPMDKSISQRRTYLLWAVALFVILIVVSFVIGEGRFASLWLEVTSMLTLPEMNLSATLTATSTATATSQPPDLTTTDKSIVQLVLSPDTTERPSTLFSSTWTPIPTLRLETAPTNTQTTTLIANPTPIYIATNKLTPKATLTPNLAATPLLLASPTTIVTYSSTNTLGVTPTLALRPTYDPEQPDNITSLVELAPNEIMRLGRGEIHDVAYASDGKHLAVATSLGVWFYDLKFPKYSWLLSHIGSVSSVTWSPDGTKLAAGLDNDTVRIWDMASSRLLGILKGHTNDVSSVRWSPDGKKLASSSSDKTVRIWDVASGKSLATLEGHTNSIYSVSWSPDGKKLASGSFDDTVRIWDTASGKLLATLEGHKGPIYSVSWSPDGKKLASGSFDDTIRIWDMANDKLIATFEGYTGSVSSVSWSLDGTRLASGSTDGMVRIWDMTIDKLLSTLEGHTNGVRSVSWSPDGNKLASGSHDDTVRIWDVASSKSLVTLEGYTNPVSSVSWSPDGNKLATVTSYTPVRIWDMASGKPFAILDGYTGDIHSVSWSPDGTKLAFGSTDGTVRIWDLAGGETFAILEGHKSSVTSLSWSPDGIKLASSSYDDTVRIWDVASGKSLITLGGRKSSVISVSWSPIGTKLAAGSDDGTVRIWDMANDDLLTTLEDDMKYVYSVSWSPDGTKLASGSDDGTVRIWDMANDDLLATLKGHSGPVYSVGWSPDGTKLASGSYDRTVRIWNVTSSKSVATLDGHEKYVKSVSWSPDGTKLASGSDDGIVRIWNVPLETFPQ